MWFFVPCRYLKTFFAAFQCSNSWLLWYLPNMSIAKLIFDIVHIWAYTKLTTTNVWGISFIYFRSKSFFEHCRWVHLSPFCIGTWNVEHLSILNLSNTFWDKPTSPCYLSCNIPFLSHSICLTHIFHFKLIRETS